MLAPDLCILVMAALDGGKSHCRWQTELSGQKISDELIAWCCIRLKGSNLLYVLSDSFSGGVNSSEHPVWSHWRSDLAAVDQLAIDPGQPQKIESPKSQRALGTLIFG